MAIEGPTPPWARASSIAHLLMPVVGTLCIGRSTEQERTYEVRDLLSTPDPLSARRRDGIPSLQHQERVYAVGAPTFAASIDLLDVIDQVTASITADTTAAT